MASKLWYCYERSCHVRLGVVINGELSIQKNETNVSMMTTEGAILNVHCSRCGRINKWAPKDSALIQAVLRTHLVKALISEVAVLFTKGKQRAELEEEDEIARRAAIEGEIKQQKAIET